MRPYCLHDWTWIEMPVSGWRHYRCLKCGYRYSHWKLSRDRSAA